MLNTLLGRFKKFISNNDIIANIQAYDSIIPGWLNGWLITMPESCIGFTDFVLSNKWLIEFSNLFSPNNL